MWRASLILGLGAFSLGALSSLGLLAFHVIKADFLPAAGFAAATAFLAWGAFACRRDLQRLKQEREFRAGTSK